LRRARSGIRAAPAALTATALRGVLRAHADPANAAGARRYFVDGVETYGVPSGNMDEAALATGIIGRFKRHLVPAHFATLNRWVDGLQDWASTDSLCGDLIGPLICAYPDLIMRVVPWTRSRHRWRRRAAAVSLIPLARTGERLPAILRVADRLLGDPDPMVQKGVGWLLKEATKRRADMIVAYLVSHRHRTSRLVLRYASEKLPAGQRRRVLSR
jgi:3-methyladenine DNA glycosylase AlkD